MGLFINILKEILISVLTEPNSDKTADTTAPQKEPQPNNTSAVTSFEVDYARLCEWWEISDKDVRKKVIVDYLLTLNDASYTMLVANLEEMKQNVINCIQKHEENEKYAWGTYIEEQIAYFNAKHTTGASDPEWTAQMNDYKLSLDTMSWIIHVCESFWDVKKRNENSKREDVTTNLKLFYSHAWADKAGSKVKKLLLLLQKNYEVWLDKKQIDLGTHINNTVAMGIEKCDIFIIVWSRNANESKGVLFELETAVHLNKPILILLIEDFDISHSPYLAGKEYIDFSGNQVSFNQQVVYLNDFLLRKRIELLKKSIISTDNRAEVEKIDKKCKSLQDVLIELEDIIKRQKMNASGNDDSDVYIKSSLDAFEKMWDQNEEGKLMLQFSAKMKEISAKYPLQADDKTKQLLAIKAIEDIDPLGKNDRLTELKSLFEQKL